MEKSLNTATPIQCPTKESLSAQMKNHANIVRNNIPRTIEQITNSRLIFSLVCVIRPRSLQVFFDVCSLLVVHRACFSSLCPLPLPLQIDLLDQSPTVASSL